MARNRQARCAVRAEAAAIWGRTCPQQPPRAELLDRWRRRSPWATPRRQTLELCSKPPGAALPSEAWLPDPKLPPLVGANLRLYYGRWLGRACGSTRRWSSLPG